MSQIDKPISILPTDALIVVDLQNDFCRQGALAVTDGDAVVGPINALARLFDVVVLTQDWHTPDHASFASSHGKAPFEMVDLHYGPQALWPDHCVMGTAGADFHPALDIPGAQLVVRKGFNPHVDSYSAFREADGITKTDLADYLTERRVTRIFVVGLATDFCVGFTALDGRLAGFDVVVIEDLCRAIDVDGSLAKMHEAWKTAGVGRMTSQAFAG